MNRAGKTAFLIALLVGLTACLKWPDAEASFNHPDKALFERAAQAISQGRFDIARVTLQTLIDSYPNSDYERRAEILLAEPSVAACGQSWGVPAPCDAGFSTPTPD
jgi:TolA-binding protein